MEINRLERIFSVITGLYFLRNIKKKILNIFIHYIKDYRLMKKILNLEFFLN